ncbi:DUF4347 domain-containing protein, partial [Nitrosomonas europaea]|uniref:DUF4347 domain-containing protein n=1 Tax=Nitrosomonas europaea TaxID=915 RepID=UPI002BA348DA
MFQKNNAKAQKLLIVDTDVLDSEILLADLQSDFRTTRLSRETDPVLQISQALFSHQPVREIILLAHANPGKIHFTDYVLDLTELDSRKDELRDWRNWVTDDARLSIYACQLASNETGRAFIQELGNLTGMAVAASSQPVGNLGTSRNWNLDRFTQPFEVPVPFTKQSLAEYPHQLAPVITFNRNESVLAVTEGNSSGKYLEFTVTLSEPAISTVRIYYRTLDAASTATGKVDYNEASSYIQIAAGESSGTISVQVYGDSTDEVDESVVLELYNPSNAVFPDGANTLRTTGVILDDDGTANNRALFVSQVQIVESNDGSQQAVFEVQLSRPSTDSITLSYTTADGSALAGQDYQAMAGTLTFLPGETLKTVAVPIIGDTVAEANEFFNLVFTPTAAIANGVEGAVGTAVILDDDTSTSLPEISISGTSTIEGNSNFRNLEFTVTLSEPATSTVRIYYRTLDAASTATGGVDYNETSSYIQIAAGESSGTISVQVY